MALSLSRPQFSNDNAHAESTLRMMKAQPDKPKRFPNAITARQSVDEHVHRANHDHHHVSLALMTPADIYFGRVEQIMVIQKATYDEVCALRRQRWPNGRPMAKAPPNFVDIDPGCVHAYGDGWHDTVRSTHSPTCRSTLATHSPSAKEGLKF